MDQQEWMGYVSRLANGEYPVPVGMIQDYNDWRCRSIVGRALYWMGDTESAMRVLSTVVNVEPNMDDDPEYGLSEAEHKVLCLRDIAEIVWKLAKSEEAALTYLKEAYDLSRAYKHSFHSCARGDMFYRRLMVLSEAGKTQQAVDEAKAMVEAEKDNNGVNPYKYFALKFLAEDAHNAGDDAKASEIYAESFKYYPQNDIAERDLAKAAAEEDAAKRYKAYEFCSTVQYKPWEKQRPIVLRRGIDDK